MGNHYCASNKPKSEKPETSYLFNQNQLTKDFSRNNSSSPISKSFSQIDKTKPKPNKKKTISNNPTELSKTLTFISHTQELSKIYDTNTFFLQTSSLLYSPEYLKLKNEILFTTHIRFSTNDIRILGNKGSICERSAEITEKPSLSKIGTPKMHNGNRDLSSPKEDGSTPHFDKKSDISLNSQSKIEDFQISFPKILKDDKKEESFFKDHDISLKEKLSQILKTNVNRSINDSMSELKFSGFLEPNDDQPHHIHLNLANFLKDDDDEENKGGLTKENLETLNKINEKKKNYNNKVILNKNISLKKNNFNQLKIGRNESIAKNSEKSAKFQIKKQNFKFKTPLNNVHINESKRKIEKESDIQKNIVKKNEKFSLYLKNRS